MDQPTPPIRTLSAVCLLFLIVTIGCGPGDPAPVPAPEAAAARAPETVVEERREVVHATLGRRGTLDGTLRGLELTEDERIAVIEALGEEIDLRKLSPRTGFTLSRDAAGRLVVFACRAAADRYVRIEFGEDGAPVGKQVDVPVETHTETAGGVIESSVAQAFSRHDHATEMVAAYADIFQWDVDLLIDPRPGDQVRVIYEIRSIGEVPPDMPRFRGAGSKPGELIGLGRILAASYEGERAAAEAFWVSGEEGGGDYYDRNGDPLRKTFLKSPLNYRRISSGFTHARRHPITRKVVPHHGVDFAAPSGTPVVAAADGKVVSAGWSGALGKTVKVRHGSEYTTVYGHLRGYARGIRSGVRVKQGQVVGYVGATGRATGPHLHYSMIRSGSAINPMRFKNPPVDSLPEALRPALEDAVLGWQPVLAAIRVADPSTRFARSRVISLYPEDRIGG